MRNENDEEDLDDKKDFSFDDEDLLEDSNKGLFGRGGSTGSLRDFDFDFESGLDDDRDRELELEDASDGLGDVRKNSSRYGNLEEARERDLWNLEKDERISIEEPEEKGNMMSLKDGLGSVKDLLFGGVEGLMGLVREMGSEFLDLNDSEDESETNRRVRTEGGDERIPILDERERDQSSGDGLQSNFIPISEIFENVNFPELRPSINPAETRQLGEAFVMQLNNVLGTEFEFLISEYLSQVDGLLGSDSSEIQKRVYVGEVNENGNQQYVIPDMTLFRNGTMTNLLEMKISSSALKLKDIEYVAEYFPETSAKFIFLKSSEDKSEEKAAIEGLVDEYLDQYEGDENARLNQKSDILSRTEVWNMDDVTALLSEDLFDTFKTRIDKISDQSVFLNEDYTVGFTLYNKLRSMTEELKESTRTSVEVDGLETVEQSIKMAENGDNAYQSYVNMSILQKVIAEKAMAPGALQDYLGLAENTTLNYTNPMIASGIIQHTEIYPGTAFLYFRDEDRPTFYSTLRLDTRAGFELMQKEGILPDGEVTHYEVAEILGDRPQRQATVFNLFNTISVIGESDIANLIGESHLESAKIADKEMKWMYNQGMINRAHLPWDSGHYYYWLKSVEKPGFNEIRKFMDIKTLQSIEFIENMADYQFNTFNEFRKFFAKSDSNSSLDKSWRKAMKILPIIQELESKGYSEFSFKEIKDIAAKVSNFRNKTLELRIHALTDSTILKELEGNYSLNKDLTSKDIVSKIHKMENEKVLTYSKRNFELNTDLKIAKKYTLDRLGNEGIEREKIIELKGYGQKLYYICKEGEIDIFHAGSLKNLLPEYKDKSLTEGLRKLTKLDIIEKFTIPKNLKGSGHLLSYFRPKGNSEASFGDLRELLDNDIKSLLEDLNSTVNTDIWKLSANDFRKSTFKDRWLQDLRVLVLGHQITKGIDESQQVVHLDQLEQAVKDSKIFKSTNSSSIRVELSRSLIRLSKSNLDDFKIRKIDSQLYEFNL